MVCQTVIAPANNLDDSLFFRGNFKKLSDTNAICITDMSEISTDTYMNLFDANTWERYTGIKRWIFQLVVQGQGIITLNYKTKKEECVVLQKEFHTLEMQKQTIDIPFSCEQDACFFFFKLIAHGNVILYGATYRPQDEISMLQSDVKLAVNICTYHRREQLLQNLNSLKETKFFNKEEDLCAHMHIFVTDNASEINVAKEKYITIVHNANTGGSGGFKRGLEEIRDNEKKQGVHFSHVVFMDDDVEVIPESFYRLYALLSYIKDEYREEVVAGRMMRIDNKNIQYTAAEIWNGGELKHVGENVDMSSVDSLNDVNVNDGAEYSGWWFACFPMPFARKQDPLPFFLHCDDVEYGLRHGGTPIILNGIQVWHETHEYRQSPVIAYYDMRNMLYVNELYHIRQNKTDILQDWINRASFFHSQKEWLTEYLVFLAFRDYMKGIEYLTEIDSEQYHKKLLRKRTNRLLNAIVWRILKIKFLIKNK